MASNPYVNKVDLANGTTLIDLSTDTATQADVAQGKYFHLPTGERVQGTASGGGGTGGITQDQNGYLVLSPDGDFPTLITKTITQNGTYDAEDDNADGYSSVTVNVSGGGGGQYAYYGSGTELVSTKTLTFNLKDDTSFDTWTASTSATQIRAASSTPDLTLTGCTLDYTYIFEFVVKTNVVLLNNTNHNNTPIKFVRSMSNYVTPVPAQAYWQDGTLGQFSSTATLGDTPPAQTEYYNGSGNIAVINNGYGPMYISSIPTIASTASGSAYDITWKCPLIYARCNSTYFATSQKANIDSENTNMVVTINAYRVPRANSYPGVMTDRLIAFLATT